MTTLAAVFFPWKKSKIDKMLASKEYFPVIIIRHLKSNISNIKNKWKWLTVHTHRSLKNERGLVEEWRIAIHHSCQNSIWWNSVLSELDESKTATGEPVKTPRKSGMVQFSLLGGELWSYPRVFRGWDEGQGVATGEGVAAAAAAMAKNTHVKGWLWCRGESTLSGTPGDAPSQDIFNLSPFSTGFLPSAREVLPATKGEFLWRSFHLGEGNPDVTFPYAHHARHLRPASCPPCFPRVWVFIPSKHSLALSCFQNILEGLPSRSQRFCNSKRRSLSFFRLNWFFDLFVLVV